MKILFNSNFKAIRKGQYAEANSAAGEFLHFAGEPATLTSGQLQEIATANKITLPHTKTKAAMQAVIDEALMNDKNIPEQNKETETQLTERVVKSNYNGSNDDEVMMELVKNGISFRHVNRLFKAALETLGLRASTKDIKTRVQELIAESKALESYDQVQKLAEKAIADMPGAKVGAAMQAIKAYAKANEMQLPEKPKGARGAVGFKGKVYEFILENPACTDAELSQAITDAGKDPSKYKSLFQISKLAKKLVEKYGQ